MSDAFAEMLQRPAIQHFVGLAHKRSVPPKQTLMHAGDSPQSLYLILEGSVSILLEDDEGREIVLAYLNPGEFFGEMCLFPQQPVRSAIVRCSASASRTARSQRSATRTRSSRSGSACTGWRR